MLRVQPVVDEPLARRAFRLRDLVLMMREDKVNAAAVYIKRLAEILHGHRGAFDVPAGPAAPDLRVPRGIAPLINRFPEREVARVLFVVLVCVHALAAADDVAREVDLRELAVFWKRLDAVIDRT